MIDIQKNFAKRLTLEHNGLSEKDLDKEFIIYTENIDVIYFN